MVKSVKKILLKIKTSFAFAYFVAILVIFLPNAITMPSLSFRGAIVTAIGVDKIEDEVEISVLTLSSILKEEKSENSMLVSGRDSTVANAIANIESQIGRRLKMGHTGYVVISQSLATENIANVINSLSFTTKLPNTVSLVLSRESAKEILQQSNSLEQSSMYKLKEIIQNEFNVNYTKDTSLDSFLKGYYSETSTSTLGYIKIENDFSTGISSSQQNSNSNQQSSSAQTSQEEKKVISFQREHAVFVNGILKYITTVEEMKGVNWVVENNLQQIITIKNVTEQGLNDATISLEVQKNIIHPKVEFLNNVPHITFNLSLKLNIVEILQSQEHVKSFKEIKISNDINQKIEDEIKKEISFSLGKFREEKTDVMGIYKILYFANHKKFEKFLSNLEDKNDFLKYVQVYVKVDSQIIAN